MSLKRRKVFGVVVIITAISCMYLYVYYKVFVKQNMEKALTPSHNSDTKYILFWTKMYSSKNFYFMRSEFELFEGCEYNNCYATADKRFLPIERFDAYLFHGVHYDPTVDGRPKKRTAKQRYVFVDLEPPIYTHGVYGKPFANFYNWTMSYRKDADILRQYGSIVTNESSYMPPSAEALERKTKLAAWTVSRCESQSQRERYVKILQRYVPVDIYGDCGPFKCPKSAGEETREKCYRDIERNYKFYLSFENSLCREYLTEKLYNILKYDVVPIVNGFREDYERMAPPNSYIHIDDYPNPAALAEYLTYLDKNNEKYLKYFEWKKEYVSDKTVYSRSRHAACRLCKMLHNRDEPPKVYGNIYEWLWGKNESMCKAPPEWDVL